ncbi:hypothetical protein B0H14DRAFT_2744820 [Mycena olivaceomarginata]|uniref:Uncharacterized protein n=1 Tax=Mycena albidolilacea TaxID=1033008 RepID=A0AAD7EBK5_9AGAR|nr:hypothetical protein DFH08DRAFT_918418 [Mycena albidolilacea]KAJ7860446.1 hypothetical protein B0H14DRAFT_2744820 [Mycena olivaceomarginata]
MIFFLSIAAFLVLLFMLSFRYRASLLPHVPERVLQLFPTFNNYRPLATFSEQIGAGMSSADFDLEANVRDEDSRSGLDEQGTREIMEIMRRERVNFDQARLIRHNRILAQNGIDPSGMPMDSKAITRL